MHSAFQSGSGGDWPQALANVLGLLASYEHAVKINNNYIITS